LAKSGSRIAVHHELHVMVWRIEPAKGIHAMGILWQVIPCVPTVFGYIQSAGKRDGIIDHNDLLMMRCAYGMAAVETKMDPPMGAPGMGIKRNDFAIGGIDHREIPQQHINAESPITAHQIVQEVSEAWRSRISRIETEPAIELPTGNEDKTLCAF
jgi:hypothetical protein